MSNYSNFRTRKDYKQYLIKRRESNSKIKNAYYRLDDDENHLFSVIEDTNLTAQEFIEITALCRLKGYNSTAGGGNRAAENETDRLYAKNHWKFIEEMLQNADDCTFKSEPEVCLCIDASDEKHSSIEFIYNETGFDRNDVWAITSFSESTKINGMVKGQEEGVFYKEKTGRKGKGFKSVFSLQAENIVVHIRSNGFSFKLDNQIGRILPVWEDDPNRFDNRTHVIVEFIRPIFSIKDIYPEVKRLFCADSLENMFAENPLLFMHRLRRVNVQETSADGEHSFCAEYHEEKESTKYLTPFSPKCNKAILSGIVKDGVYYKEQMQSGKMIVSSKKATVQSVRFIRYTRMVEEDITYRNYSVIAPFIDKHATINWKNGALYSTFPLSQHRLPIPLAVDAPFMLNSDRSGIQYNSFRGDDGQQVTSNEWNTAVRHELFENGGVFESFFIKYRSQDSIRMDRYLCVDSGQTILFSHGDNYDGHGHQWVPEVKIGDLCRSIRVLRVFNNNHHYVSYNDARQVSFELFTWPDIHRLFGLLEGKGNETSILSEQYADNSFFRKFPVFKRGFTDSLNQYLDELEDKFGLTSAEMVSFFNDRLYPFLKGNVEAIKKEESNAFERMRILICRHKKGNEVITTREMLKGGTKWFHSDHGETVLSIHRYCVFESSPVNLSLILDEVEEKGKRKHLHDAFRENHSGVASKLESWDEIRDYIEAACYYQYDISKYRFPALSHYVLSEKYDPEFNAFRTTGIVAQINDTDIEMLSQYFDHNTSSTVEALKQMGIRVGTDLFHESAHDLELTEDTIRCLEYPICQDELLPLLKREQERYGKLIRAGYNTVQNVQMKALLYFLNRKYNLFSLDSYRYISEGIVTSEKYWNRDDADAAELLIRACEGIERENVKKYDRTISIRIREVLERQLEPCIEAISSKLVIKQLIILNDGTFDEIPQEEITPRLKMLGCGISGKLLRYYKGNLSAFGGTHHFLKDMDGHVFLNCDDSGNYNPALEEYSGNRFDPEILQMQADMEDNYRTVEREMIKPILDRTTNLNKTYQQLEARFPQLSKRQIIAVLSWFRSQGYTNALGNGNINSEKEIEDDYRSTPWKFIYEFIQNVDDCIFTEREKKLRISINSEQNSITFAYNEIGFTTEDIIALTKFGDSNKIGKREIRAQQDGPFELEKTGRKGRGFKSVFSLPGEGVIVHICSNGFSFKIVKKIGTIIPIWEEVEDAPETGSRITVEGFENGFLERLIPKVREMFGTQDLSVFLLCARSCTYES